MTEGLKVFTANYINADSNFAIHNLGSGRASEADLPFYCVLNNILQRGCPTIPSQFLKSKFKGVGLDHKVRLLSRNIPNWEGVIKGGNNNNPAMEFYYRAIPHFFPDIPFLQQLIIPEYPIGLIIDDAEGEFIDQKVDFYIPEAELVIEIDGEQHLHPQQMILDSKRDAKLENVGVKTVRVRADDIRQNSDGLETAIKRIKDRLQTDPYSGIIQQVKSDYESPNENFDELLKQVATIRLQIAMVHLLLNGSISRKDTSWNIAVYSREVSGYEKAAIEDVLIWMEELYMLAGEMFTRPRLDLTVTEDLNNVPRGHIRIDISTLEVGTPVYTREKDTIYITASPDQRTDFFIIETGAKIDYFTDSVSSGEMGDVLNKQRQSLLFFLKNLFGFNSFNSGQERIIINTLKCRDTIGVLPTGSGKSLCYQMCILLQPSIHICVSPIKALMVDQSQNLHSFGITRIAYISSDLKPEERAQVQRRFSEGRFILTLISPERFQSEDFRAFIQAIVPQRGKRFGYAVIDEVHCMSEWGHSFRVSYLNLVKAIREYCGDITLLGLTATASLNVLKNIKIEFGMDLDNNDDVISVPYFTRENLHFSVKKHNGKTHKDKYEELKDVVDSFLEKNPRLFETRGDATDCGLIFTPHVNGKYGCKTLSDRLGQDYREYNADIRFFSGSIPKKAGFKDNRDYEDYKRRIQNDFKLNRFPLLVATKAFGIGIDKPNIKYTIHYGTPSSREALYQEAGRAGRDRTINEAECTVVFTPENEKTMTLLDQVFAPFTSVEEIKEISDEIGYDGEDVQRQLFLLASGLVTRQNEIACAEYVLDRISETQGSIVPVKAMNSTDFDILQKVLYHMSVVGIISDWTVDWKINGANIYPNQYDRDTLIRRTKEYISKYSNDEQLKTFDDTLNNASEHRNYEIPIINAFYSWYENNIIYSRRMALKDIYEDCVNFEDPDEFKEKLEAYFRLDELTDMMGSIADNGLDYENWFAVLDADAIKKKRVSNILPTLSRFLETYQYNAGLNFISGVLELLSDEEPRNMDRMEHALKIIDSMEGYEKILIAEKTFILFKELGSERSKERISEFFINGVEEKGLEARAYSILQDNYSLSILLKKALSSIVKKLEV